MITDQSSVIIRSQTCKLVNQSNVSWRRLFGGYVGHLWHAQTHTRWAIFGRLK